MEEVKVKENVRLCEYGCGREAKHRFKNGKWCCETNQSKCPETRKKIKQRAWTKEVRENRRQTCLENHNVEHPSQSKEIKEKKKQTNMRNRGVENPSQSKEIKEKKKKTCFKNHGVCCPLQIEEVREKLRQTCLEKYDEIQDKIKKTCLKKYNVEHPSQTIWFKLKVKKTCFKKYGVGCSLQSEMIKEKIIKTCLRKYGEVCYAKTKENRQRARDSYLRRIKNCHGQILPLYNPSGCNIIENLNDNGFNFQHAENGGEYRVIGYFLDGYDEEKNIAIEIDEPEHSYNYRQKKDIRRQQEITEELGCRFVRVKVDKDNNILDVDDEEFKNILMENYKQ